MTPPILLSHALPPSSLPFGRDSITHTTTALATNMTVAIPTTSTHSPESITRAHPCRQWTGAPIRATIPLPRRLRQPISSNGGAYAQSDTVTPSARAQTRHIEVGRQPDQTRYFCGDTSSSESFDMDIALDADADEDERDEPGEDAGRAGYVDEATRSCSYESITAAKGLAAWSFEELRAECYAQSLIARGAKPPPADRGSLAIPPAFVPRVVLQTHANTSRKQ